MKKLIFAAAALFAALPSAQAAGGCQGPWCPPHQAKHGYPVFQAAPWYLYWPYNAHFQTASPMTGAYYAPPTAGGTLQSPYFPAPQYAPQGHR